jgi:hypothetical protein
VAYVRQLEGGAYLPRTRIQVVGQPPRRSTAVPSPRAGGARPDSPAVRCPPHRPQRAPGRGASRGPGPCRGERSRGRPPGPGQGSLGHPGTGSGPCPSPGQRSWGRPPGTAVPRRPGTANGRGQMTRGDPRGPSRPAPGMPAGREPGPCPAEGPGDTPSRGACRGTEWPLWSTGPAIDYTHPSGDRHDTPVVEMCEGPPSRPMLAFCAENEVCRAVPSSQEKDPPEQVPSLPPVRRPGPQARLPVQEVRRGATLGRSRTTHPRAARSPGSRAGPVHGMGENPSSTGCVSSSFP